MKTKTFFLILIFFKAETTYSKQTNTRKLKCNYENELLKN
jgi:hypothetical protein